MMFLVVGFALLLHVFFWGAGLALLGMPRRWRRFWPVLAFPSGFALQSLVVWLGAHAGLPGTNAYAWPAEIIPVLLLVVAVRQSGWRAARSDLGRFGLVWMATGASMLTLVVPHLFASRSLATLSLGSCDAADYAAGARVFMEFARGDRSGFLGLTEVVRVMSADNFFNFWLRLNHFTPSALIALNGSILDCQPHEITGLLTAVILASTVPVVFWVARAVFGYSGAASLIIATVYGFSPVTWYSFAQVSPAPLLAAQALALLTWSGIALWNGRLDGTAGWRMAPVLAIAYAIVLGAYNFILLVGLTPAVAYAGAAAVRRGAWARFGRWLLLIVAPLVLMGLVYWTRVEGLAERFVLFQTYDFGWKIPVLSPEGWLGLVRGGDLRPWWGIIRWPLAAVIVVGLVWAMVRSAKTRPQRVWLVATTTVPVLVGYAFLQLRGAMLGTNASYDAFKLFAVFYPVLLPAFCWWITIRWSTRLLEWLGVVGFAALVIGGNLLACVLFIVQLSRPPLVVGSELRQLRRVEAFEDVASLNMLIPDMWSRLWANAFLLRKPQYFATHTYEGRLNTELQGEWDLVGGIVRSRPVNGAVRIVTPTYELVDTRAPGFVRGQFAEGWHEEERLPDGASWRWSSGDGALQISNPQRVPVEIVVWLDVRGVEPRRLIARVNQEPATREVIVPEVRGRVALPPVVVPPGESRLEFDLSEPTVVLPGDGRPLGICVYRLELHSRPVR